MPNTPKSSTRANVPATTATGSGGETHQKGGDTLTTNFGVSISDNQNSLKAGERGPTLLDDFVLREKIFHFDHERIPERIVHARGSGAHGVFEATANISALSKAAVFMEGAKTETFVRFSTVVGGAGSVDTPRDVRGFAVKLYTSEGNWDLVGNNIPVFFIQDAIKFPDLIHSVKMEADRGYPQAASAHDTAPRCPFGNFQRDGMMQTMVPKGRANYEPNSLGDHGEDGGPRESEQGFHTVEANGGRNDASAKLRIRPASFADHFSQARLFFRSQSPIEQAHIASALVFELSKVTIEAIRTRVLGNLRNVDEDLAKRVAAGLAMELPAASKAAIDTDPSDALSIVKQGDPPMKGRKVAILFDEGSDKAAINRLKSEVEAKGGTVFTVAPKVGGLKLSGGTMKADGQLAGSPSVLFDAVALVLSKASAEKLTADSAAVDFVSNAFVHVKTIGCSDGAKPLLDRAGVKKDAGVVALDQFATVAPRRH